MTRTTRAAVLVAALALASCGGGGGSDSGDAPLPDQSASFVGRWDGTFSMTIEGQTSSALVYVPITRNATNSINVGGFCLDGSGVDAQVTSSSSFLVDGLTCPPQAIGTCPAVTFTFLSGGTGSLANGQLTMNVAGSMSGCAKSFPFTTTFVGARTSTDPQAITIARDDRVENDTVAAAIAAGVERF